MISSIRLINCQSWEDSTIHLSGERLNVIEAKNNVGKSVLMKMLKISVSPKFFKANKRKKLIRWGATDAKAVYHFTDGAAAIVSVQPTRVIYFFKDVDEDKFTAHLEPPVEMLQELGVLMNNDKTFIANILDTDQALLLVDSEASATFEFVDLLCSNATLNEMHDKVDELQKKTDLELSDAKDELLRLNSELSHLVFVDIDREEEKLKFLSELKNAVYDLVTAGIALVRMNGNLTTDKNFDELISLSKCLCELEKLNFSRLSVKEFSPEPLLLCALEEQFNLLEFEKLCIPHNPSGVEILQVLENLERVKFEKFKVQKSPDGSPLRPLVALDKLVACIDRLETALATAKVAESMMIELDDKLRSAGEEYECPIFGRVIFDGKECVSCDY